MEHRDALQRTHAHTRENNESLSKYNYESEYIQQIRRSAMNELVNSMKPKRENWEILEDSYVYKKTDKDIWIIRGFWFVVLLTVIAEIYIIAHFTMRFINWLNS